MELGRAGGRDRFGHGRQCGRVTRIESHLQGQGRRRRRRANEGIAEGNRRE